MPYKDRNKAREASRKSAAKRRVERGLPTQISASIKPWRLKNPEKYLEQKKRWYRKHNEREKQKHRDRAFLLRKMVLTHYSNGLLECACCGENIYAFLTLNHLKGGGTKERKAINPALSRTLINKNYPKGYDVLCYNCNCADAFNKGCPHKKVAYQKIKS